MFWATIGLTLAGSYPAQIQDREAKLSVFGHDTHPDFRRFDPTYSTRINKSKARLERLQKELNRQTMAGRKTHCSRQLYVEAHWLTYYTADYGQIDDILTRLEAMLKEPKDPSGESDQADDGSYGGCQKAWFYRLDATCDRLVVEDKPKKRLAFLDRINSPAKLTNYLDSVLTSDVPKTGIDNRFELNIAGTDLLRLIDGHLPSGYAFDPRLGKVMNDWVTKKWQDPKTGFFGAWYTDSKGLKKTSDLSCTFHVAHFMDGKIGHWQEITRTILAMKDLEYPYGWLQEGQLSNHHNYDIVTLFHFGWPSMTESERGEAKSAIRIMLRHCLKNTLKPDGSFNMEDESTVGQSFVFPVQFLSEIGYFNREARFWTDESFPEAHGVADKIASKIKSLGLDDAESQTALYLVQIAD